MRDIKSKFAVLAKNHQKMQKFLLFFLFPLFFTQAQSDGILDVSFGNNGYVRTHVGELDDEINDFFINEDNSIVAIGRTYKGGGDYDFALSKLTESGELDENFGENGINTTTNLPRGIPTVILKLNSGKILAGGIYSPQFGSTYAVLVRYNEDGTVDETFAESGKLFLPYTTIRYIRTIQKQEDDKIIIGGYKEISVSNPIATIIRLNADGTFDNSFNGTGILNISNTPIEKLIVQQDGKYVFGGNVLEDNNDNFSNVLLARVNSDGTLDTTFGNNGKVEWDVEADDDFNDFTLSNSGEIFVTGTSVLNYDYRTFISKIHTNGELDTSFGVNGSKILSLINYDYSRSEQPSSIILDPGNHYIYIGGYFNTNYSSYSYNGFVAKLNLDGEIVTEFGEDGILNFGYTFNKVYKILFDNAGRIIAGGEEEAGDDDFMQARVITTTEVSTHTITVSAAPTTGGTVTGGGTYDQGTSATVIATANTGYTFVNWMENGNVISTSTSYTFTVNGNRNLMANFSLNSHTITVSASPSTGGTVTGGGNYNFGASATVTATPNAGYTFLNWTENGTVVSMNSSYTFTVNDNRNFIANFSQNAHTITVSASPATGGTVTGSGTFNYGTSITVTATPNADYSFVNWSENGTVVSTNSQFSFTVESDRNLVATFTESMSVTDWAPENIEFYPNPVRDFLNIKSKKAVKSVSAFDLSGQRVLSSVKPENGRIDLRNLDNGTYMLRIVLENGTMETFKVLKR